MGTKLKLLKESVEQVAEYLEQFLPLANVHMVDYFTNNVYVTFIPINIQREIKNMGYKEVINKIFSNDYEDMPHLHHFAKKSTELTLKNLDVCLKKEGLQDKLSSLGCADLLRLKLNVFMTSKKSHEVDILSYTAAALKNISGTTHLIDIGDGKGYLSSMLALHHKIPVLGVDASEINTSGAMTRVKKLSRVWQSEVSKHSVLSVSQGDQRTSEDLYKQVTKYVDERIDFEELVTNVFLEKPNGLGLVGLHTCGHLATTSLKIFSTNRSVKTICNVGCCYHFLRELFESEGEFQPNDMFLRQEEDKKDVLYGFPMSDFLRERKFTIGRAGRMLAAQSVDRILDKKELPSETLFFRALFEVLLDAEFKHLTSRQRHVGRFRKKANNFADYTKMALKRLNLNSAFPDSNIEGLLEEYKDREYELYVFFLIRNMLSPIIESLVLLDRLLYLRELGFEESYLVQFFDPVISPRCYGLVALK